MGAHKSTVLRFELCSESLLAEEEYLDKREQRERLMCHPRCCVSAYVSVVILTPILKPSMKASFSERAISESWQFSICSIFSFCCSVVSMDRSSSSNLVISDSFFLLFPLCLYSLGLMFPKLKFSNVVIESRSRLHNTIPQKRNKSSRRIHTHLYFCRLGVNCQREH